MPMSRKEFLKKSGKGILAAGALAGVNGMISCDKNKVETKLRIFYRHKDFPLKHSWTIARSTFLYKNNVILKLEKDGRFGLGEAAHNIRYGENLDTCTEAIELIKPKILELDPWHYVDVGQTIQDAFKGQSSAKAGVDIAMMDWAAKGLGVPLYQMLGIDAKKAPMTSFSIGIDRPEVIKKKVEEAEPYPILKIKMGGENDDEIMKAVRSVTDKVLRVDANEGWINRETAARKMEWLAKNNVEFVEQPMPAGMLEETAWLKERAEIPIIADEAIKSPVDIPQLAEAYDGINIKLMKSGGIQEALKEIWIARTFDLKVMLGCMVETSIGITAAAHLSPLVDYADLDGNLLLAEDPFEGVKVVDGWLILPDEPGLGVKGEFRT